MRAIAELVGGTAPRTAGQPHAQVAQSREEIPAALFPPYWREALSDLLASYDRICSYLCLYIPRGTGTPSVDHMITKSVCWDQIYQLDYVTRRAPFVAGELRRQGKLLEDEL